MKLSHNIFTIYCSFSLREETNCQLLCLSRTHSALRPFSPNKPDCTWIVALLSYAVQSFIGRRVWSGPLTVCLIRPSSDVTWPLLLLWCPVLINKHWALIIHQWYVPVFVSGHMFIVTPLHNKAANSEGCEMVALWYRGGHCPQVLHHVHTHRGRDRLITDRRVRTLGPQPKGTATVQH